MADRPRVSIIMRTRNRPDFLGRAMASVAAQTFADWQLVVVDGGGLPATAESVRNFARHHPGRVVHTLPEGDLRVGALINVGVAEGDSEYITLLDDDDTWQPEFLEKTVAVVEHSPALLVAGAVCQTTCLKEENRDGRWETVESFPLDERMHDLTLYDLAASNRFTVNAFLYRRDSLDAVGYYDENLVVAEDWDFNLRFLRHYDVLVLPERLANYHMRLEVSDGDDANTISHSKLFHRYRPSALINHYLRQDLDGSGNGLGMLMALARNEQNLTNQIRLFEERFIGASRKIGRIDSRTKQIKDSWAAGQKQGNKK